MVNGLKELHRLLEHVTLEVVTPFVAMGAGGKPGLTSFTGSNSWKGVHECAMLQSILVHIILGLTS